MEMFLVTLNIVLPIFLVMASGYASKQLGLVSAEVVSGMNKLTFRLFLPLSLMRSLMNVSPKSFVNGRVLAFGALGTVAVAAIAFCIVPRFVKDNARRGVMIQGLFRSNYAIFGIPLCEALFPQGDGGIAAMMVIATVPLFNVLGVISLEVYRGGQIHPKKILKGICTNPLIWGCLIGFVLMQLRIQLPEFLQSTIGKLAGIASPLALFVLGASINLSALGGNRRALAWMSLGRLVIVPVLALALAYAMGFRGAEFASLMIAFGSPCAVSSYTMAAQMGGDAELAAQQVMLTTVLCSLTMFIMIYLFKSMGIF